MAKSMERIVCGQRWLDRLARDLHNTIYSARSPGWAQPYKERAEAPEHPAPTNYQGDPSMISSMSRELCRRSIFIGWAFAAVLAAPPGGARGQQTKVDVLKIGTSGTLASGEKGGKEETALESM